MVKRDNGKLKHAPPKLRTSIASSPIHKEVQRPSLLSPKHARAPPS
jgi:hypothetical protein